MIINPENEKSLTRVINTLPQYGAKYISSLNKIKSSSKYIYATELKRFFEFMVSRKELFGHINYAAELTELDLNQIYVNDIKDYLEKRNYANDTIKRKQQILHGFFEYCKTEGVITVNPVIKDYCKAKSEKLDIISVKRFLLSIETGYALTKREQQLHHRYIKRDIAILSILLDTGISIPTLCSLNKSSVDYDDDLIIVDKSDVIKEYFITENTKSRIKDYVSPGGRQNAAPLFTNKNGERLSIRTVQAIVKKYTDAYCGGKSSGGNSLVKKIETKEKSMSTNYSSTQDIDSVKAVLLLEKENIITASAAAELIKKCKEKNKENARNK